MKEYTPLTKLSIIASLTIVSWMIFWLAVYGGLQIAIKVFGQGI